MFKVIKNLIGKTDLCSKCANTNLCQQVCKHRNEVPKRSLFLGNKPKFYCIGYCKNKTE